MESSLVHTQRNVVQFGGSATKLGDVMIYVLIIVANVHGGVQVSMQEFSNVERCKIAAENVMKATEEVRIADRFNYRKNNITAICMEK